MASPLSRRVKRLEAAARVRRDRGLFVGVRDGLVAMGVPVDMACAQAEQAVALFARAEREAPCIDLGDGVIDAEPPIRRFMDLDGVPPAEQDEILEELRVTCRHH